MSIDLGRQQEGHDWLVEAAQVYTFLVESKPETYDVDLAKVLNQLAVSYANNVQALRLLIRAVKLLANAMTLYKESMDDARPVYLENCAILALVGMMSRGRLEVLRLPSSITNDGYVMSGNKAEQASRILLSHRNTQLVSIIRTALR